MVKAKRKSARQPARKSGSKSKSKAKPKSVTVAALKRAVEGRDARVLADMYADDAVMLVIDHDNPPSNPRRLAGKAAINRIHSHICSVAYPVLEAAGELQPNRLKESDGSELFPLSRRPT